MVVGIRVLFHGPLGVGHRQQTKKNEGLSTVLPYGFILTENTSDSR